MEFKVNLVHSQQSTLFLTPKNYQEEFRIFIANNKLDMNEKMRLKNEIQQKVFTMAEEQRQRKRQNRNQYQIKQQGRIISEQKQTYKEKQEPNYNPIETLFNPFKMSPSPNQNKYKQEQRSKRQQQKRTQKKQKTTLLQNYKTKKKHHISPSQKQSFYGQVSNRLYSHQTQNQKNRKRGNMDTREELNYNEMIKYQAQKQRKALECNLQDMANKTTVSFRKKIQSSSSQNEPSLSQIKQVQIRPKPKRPPQFNLKGPRCQARLLIDGQERQLRLRKERQDIIRKRMKGRIGQSASQQKSQPSSRSCACCDRDRSNKEQRVHKKSRRRVNRGGEQLKVDDKRKRMRKAMGSLLAQSYDEFENDRNKYI